MRLHNFLNEDGMSIYQVLSDCEKFLDEFGNETRLWRGTSKSINGVEKILPRQDRTPRDTPKDIHDRLDDIFKSKFGWKSRSEGVFVSNNISQASEFGDSIYRFFPIGNYKYIYSPVINDLTSYLEDSGVITQKSGKYNINYNEEDLDDILHSIVHSYKDHGLKSITTKGKEASFYCPKGYYLIDKNFIDDNYNKLFK